MTRSTTLLPRVCYRDPKPMILCFSVTITRAHRDKSTVDRTLFLMSRVDIWKDLESFSQSLKETLHPGGVLTGEQFA
jgi:hypothetical protein